MREGSSGLLPGRPRKKLLRASPQRCARRGNPHWLGQRQLGHHLRPSGGGDSVQVRTAVGCRLFLWVRVGVGGCWWSAEGSGQHLMTLSSLLILSSPVRRMQRALPATPSGPRRKQQRPSARAPSQEAAPRVSAAMRQAGQPPLAGPTPTGPPPASQRWRGFSPGTYCSGL
jgi:hypothetical protein